MTKEEAIGAAVLDLVGHLDALYELAKQADVKAALYHAHRANSLLGSINIAAAPRLGEEVRSQRLLGSRHSRSPRSSL